MDFPLFVWRITCLVVWQDGHEYFFIYPIYYAFRLKCQSVLPLATAVFDTLSAKHNSAPGFARYSLISGYAVDRKELGRSRVQYCTRQDTSEILLYLHSSQ